MEEDNGDGGRCEKSTCQETESASATLCGLMKKSFHIWSAEVIEISNA
jgi:hypothetical protein